MNKIKVSFDFDGTISRHDVRQIAKNMMKDEDLELWIVTARYSDDEFVKMYPNMQIRSGNNYVFAVAQEVGIPKERIIFTNMIWKAEIFKNKDFAIHLDDMQLELDEIKNKTQVLSIQVHNPYWESQLEGYIRALKKVRIKRD